jgi:hypothetical protein
MLRFDRDADPTANIESPRHFQPVWIECCNQVITNLVYDVFMEYTFIPE